MASSPNRRIPKPQAELLWGASAGRCNICNTSLIRDEMTGLEVPKNLGYPHFTSHLRFDEEGSPVDWACWE